MKSRYSARIARTLSAVAFGAALASAAWANSDGRIGASGKETTFCRNCHVGGVAPDVAFEGPTAVDPASTATFRFIITSHGMAQNAAGLDVATDGGTFGLLPGEGTYLQRNEVTHTAPKPNDESGRASFAFTWQAPATPGTYTLYGAGCSVNGNGGQNGDGAARTTYAVAVGLPTATPTIAPPSATPTRVRRGCVGDCGRDEEVSVDELITGVNVALGVMLVSACPEFDANEDRAVTIDELLLAVHDAQQGCPPQ